jgi:hypothetical protein
MQIPTLWLSRSMCLACYRLSHPPDLAARAQPRLARSRAAGTRKDWEKVHTYFRKASSSCDSTTAATGHGLVCC